MRCFAFPKSERLCSKTAVKDLYDNGKSFSSYPLRVTWQTVKEDNNIRVLIWAPKAKFKRANKRNLIRRRIREGYRLHIQPVRDLCQTLNIGLNLSLVYITTEVLPTYVIEAAVKKAIDKLLKQLNDSNENRQTTDKEHCS